MPLVNPQIIRSASGEELVVLTRAEFDALSNAAFEAMEEAADIARFDARMADHNSGQDAALPPEVSAMMLKGDSLLRALRKWRGHTQQHLEFRTGLSQGYISDLESGKKSGSPEALKTIAGALDVDQKWLGPLA
jgi:hypothetical protein